MRLAETLSSARIIPVLAIRDAGHAEPLARALVEGGLTTLEVTLRTDAAIDSICRIIDRVPGATVGAGTVLNGHDLMRAQEAGATFAVSPGLTDGLLAASRESGLPLLPGVVTASEIMRGLDAGLSLFKFFPASTSGGDAALKAFSGPFPQVRFCPTGGIGKADLGRYFALPNVIAIGGSWMVPANFDPDRDCSSVVTAARAAREMVGQV